MATTYSQLQTKLARVLSDPDKTTFQADTLKDMIAAAWADVSDITPIADTSSYLLLGDVFGGPVDDVSVVNVELWRGVPTKKPITVRRLYTHTAGYPANAMLPDEMPDLDEVAAIGMPYLDVGGEFNYETTGYTLAGKIIETISGESIPQFYKKHLVDPLGLTRTDAANMGAGINTTASELAACGQMLLNRGAYGAARLMREETFQKMLPRPLTDLLGPDTMEVWGIGPRRYRLEGIGDNIIGHNAGSETIFRVDFDHQFIFVMCRNTAGKNFSKYSPQFYAAVAACMQK